MNIKFVKVIYHWLECRILRLHPDILCYSLFMKLLTVYKCRGKVGAIAFCKELRSSLYAYLCLVSNHEHSRKTVGVHRSLRFIKKYSNLELERVLRLLTSILSISRGICLKPVIDVSTITDVSRRSLKLSVIGKYRFDFWLELGYHPRKKMEPPRCLQWSKYHFTTHAGPNGHALWTAASDLLSLNIEQTKSIWIIGGSKLKSNMCTFFLGLQNLESLFSFFGSKYALTRKLSLIPSPEGKTRIVAILDYWSQTALRPLHRWIFNCLRKIPQDCTFDQGSFIHKLPDNGESYHSVDLTAATDRFPIQVICVVLRAQLGNKYVSAWKDLMVNHPFKVPGKDEYIFYKTGNPMGAYSSWASFALAHHYVVYYCCREIGIPWKSAPYVLLGDDIVIKHDLLANKYKEVIKDLGVDISERKSHTSKHFFEFAKRPHWNGSEITPFPISGIASTKNTPSLMCSVMLNECGKGWDFKKEIPMLLSDLWSRQKLPRSLIRSRSILVTTSLYLVEGLRGKLTCSNEFLEPLLAEYFPDMVKHKKSITPAVYDSWVSVSVLSMFQTSFQNTSESFNRVLRDVGDDADHESNELGSMALNLVLTVSMDESNKQDPSTLLLSIPFFCISQNVEKVYKRGKKLIIDKTTHSSWKNDVRSMMIPLSDKVFVVRNQDLLMVTSFKLSRLVLKAIGIYSLILNIPLPIRLKPILNRFPQLAKSYQGCSPMEALFAQ